MIINLDELFSGIKDEILVNDIVSFDDSYIENSGIKELKNIKINGKIYKDSNEEVNILCDVSGKMKIEDSISLDDVMYPFSFNIEQNIEEFIEKDKNSLDILEVLWQNIVLEIPIRFTTVDDYSNIQGDGWRLIDEDLNKNKNNPFLELKEKLKEE